VSEQAKSERKRETETNCVLLLIERIADRKRKIADYFLGGAA
jgi:hypothetical protein